MEMPLRCRMDKMAAKRAMADFLRTVPMTGIFKDSVSRQRMPRSVFINCWYATTHPATMSAMIHHHSMQSLLRVIAACVGQGNAILELA